MHDTVELFSENMEELKQRFRKDIAPRLHSRRVAELEQAADRFFGNVDDSVREANLTAGGRRLDPGRLAETARAGLAEIFGGEKKV
jgi:hypothetical protein